MTTVRRRGRRGGGRRHAGLRVGDAWRGDAAHARVGGPPGPRDADPGAAARVSPSRGCHPMARASRCSPSIRSWTSGSGISAARRSPASRPTPGVDGFPVWTPDGRRLIFSSERDRRRNLFWQAADGTGAVERLTESPNSAGPDGRVARRPPADLHRESPKTGDDVMQMSWTGRVASTPLVQSSFTERNGDRLARRPLARLRGE